MVKSGSMEENVFLTPKNSSAVPEITIKIFTGKKLVSLLSNHLMRKLWREEKQTL